jgi:putative FmdB family regulatory protein
MNAKKCGRIEEAFQKISDKPLRKCSHCSGKLHRLISQSSFHLKGSGWYVTDYARNSKSPASPQKKEGEANKAASPDKTSKKSGDS